MFNTGFRLLLSISIVTSVQEAVLDVEIVVHGLLSTDEVGVWIDEEVFEGDTLKRVLDG